MHCIVRLVSETLCFQKKVDSLLAFTEVAKKLVLLMIAQIIGKKMKMEP
jgi:hypothetical protein